MPVPLKSAVGEQLKIVVVNDSPEQRDAEVALLSKHGYRVSSVSTAIDIREMSKAEFPDLFLINLLGNEGYACSQMIRERSLHVGVLLITAGSNFDIRTRAFASGADNYLVNPYSIDELLAMVLSLSRRLCP